MSSTKIPPKVVVALWTRAAGRCEYAGHNEVLWRDDLTTKEINAGLIAHIVADKPGGPRGDVVRSKKLAKNLSNLMLLCHPHHRLIDHEAVAEHPEKLLVEMKRAHEERIAAVTDVTDDRRTHLVVLRAPIGDHRPSDELINMRTAVLATKRYPIVEVSELPLTQIAATERRADFWTRSRTEIEDFFNTRVCWRLAEAPAHLSLFGFAPIPLLMVLGKLVGDKTPADVYQRHREPPGWVWPSKASEAIKFELAAPKHKGSPTGDVALALSISDSVQRSQLVKAAPRGAPVYELRTEQPHRDCVRRPEDVKQFGIAWQRALDRIRAHHQNPRVHVFAAVPNSLAVEMGRTILPKVHDQLHVYDFNHELGGFNFAFRL